MHESEYRKRVLRFHASTAVFEALVSFLFDDAADFFIQSESEFTFID